MGEGLIVRKGGAGGKQSVAPTINEVSTSDNTIVFTITNNDTETAIILYEINNNEPSENSIELAGGATTDNITITDLLVSPVTLYVSTNVMGKLQSTIIEKSFTFTVVIYTAATGGTIAEYDLDGNRYRSHTFTSSGIFNVIQAGNAGNNRDKLEYLVIGGGGGGGGISTNSRGFGGGAGVYRSSVLGETSRNEATPETPLQAEVRNYLVTVGTGGGAQATGGTSEFDNIVAAGGTGGTTSAKGAFSGAGGVSKIRTGVNQTRGTAGFDGGTGGGGGNGGSGAANTGNGGNGVNRRTNMDYRDCEKFILPNFSFSHYQACLSDPSSYSYAFNHRYTAGGGGSGIVIVRYKIEPVV